MKETKTIHFVYETKNMVNDMIYVGKHSSTNPDKDKYLGSGAKIRKAIKQFGKQNFQRKILYKFDTVQQAYQKQKQMVNQQFLKRDDVYNVVSGGNRGDSTGYSVYKDKDDNYLFLKTNDERVINGQVVGANYGLVPVIDPNNLQRGCFLISKTDENYTSGKFVSASRLKTTVFDPNDIQRGCFIVSTNDERLISGQLVGVRSGVFTARDKHGNIYQITKEDQRYKKGQLEAESKGRKMIRKKDLSEQKMIKNNQQYNKEEWQLGQIPTGLFITRNVITGQKMFITKEDPRFKTGQLVGVTKGKKFYHNKSLNKQCMFFEGQQPEGWENGRFPEPRGVRHWIYKKETNEQKYCKIQDPIPEGFIQGRPKKII